MTILIAIVVKNASCLSKFNIDVLFTLFKKSKEIKQNFNILYLTKALLMAKNTTNNSLYLQLEVLDLCASHRTYFDKKNMLGFTFDHKINEWVTVAIVLPFIVFIFLVIVKFNLHFRRSVLTMFYSNNFAQIPSNNTSLV